MACGCGNRGVKLLQAIGYRLETIESEEWLVKGDKRIRVLTVLQYPTKTTVQALLREIKHAEESVVIRDT